MKKSKNYLMLGLFLLSGIVLGGLLAELAAGVPILSFLSYGQSFGVDVNNPFVLDLAIVKITFGISFQLSVAVILGLVLSIIIYKKI